MKEYEIIDTNADNIGGCGICRYKSGKNEGHPCGVRSIRGQILTLDVIHTDVINTGSASSIRGQILTLDG